MNFLTSFALGYSGEQVLEFLTNSLPNIGKRIKQAKKIGHDTKEILNVFQNLTPEKLKELDSKLSKEPMLDFNPLIATQRATQESSAQTQLPDIGKNLAKTALGTALTYYGAKKGIPLFKDIFSQSTPAEGVANEAPGPLKSPAIEQSMQPATPEPGMAIPQSTAIPIETPEEKERLEALKKFEEKKKSKKPTLLEDLEESFKKEYGQLQPTETIGSLALTPQGDLGEVESVKKGIATIKVGDQKKTRKESDLETVPLSEPDLASLYENLIQAIPEQARSSVINFAGYDANANELIFRPHSGAAYVYKDIPPEFADKLKNSMFKAKTTGENFYGAWESGQGSRFAGLSQLIRDLQKLYGGKGKEYVRKYETLVDILEEPEKAKKAKLKKEAEKRKEEKKKVKDEEKRKKKKPI